MVADRQLLHENGKRRKFTVFTEHRDTLDHLTAQIRNVLGRDDPVVVIHGGTRRDERRHIRERFTGKAPGVQLSMRMQGVVSRTAAGSVSPGKMNDLRRKACVAEAEARLNLRTLPVD
jgi:hypothetical protein